MEPRGRHRLPGRRPGRAGAAATSPPGSRHRPLPAAVGHLEGGEHRTRPSARTRERVNAELKSWKILRKSLCADPGRASSCRDGLQPPLVSGADGGQPAPATRPAAGHPLRSRDQPGRPVLLRHARHHRRRWRWGGPGSPLVHLALLVYAATAELLHTRAAALREQAAGFLQIVAELPTDPLSPTEAFGFADGLSQPRPAGLPDPPRGRSVATGEFVLGYPDGHGQLTERPLLDPATDAGRILPRDPSGTGAADLGRNGSYLVLRQLRQDVAGFRAFLSDRTRGPDGTEDVAAQTRLAAKMVGRWPNGAPLVLAPDRDDPDLASAEFDYHAIDRDGLRCPLGAHVRRANPRDSLEPLPGTARSRAGTDRHRLLRRGRGYTLDDGEQGLYFLCLVADLARQYEFVQHSWINSPVFNGLQAQPDPLMGPRSAAATFVEQARPIRRRHLGLPAFVEMRGGSYFFLLGVAALRYLAQLPA